MKRTPTILLLLVLIGILASCHSNGKITSEEHLENVSTLASDLFKGREPSTNGDSLTISFIRDQFRSANLAFPFEDGFQPLSFVNGVKLDKGNQLLTEHTEFKISADFSPLSFSGNKTAAANLVFVGYGLTINEDSIRWDEYAGIETENKWVMLVENSPVIEGMTDAFHKYGETRAKVLNALDHGAAGILLVPAAASGESSVKGLLYDKNSARYDIPIFKITTDVANALLNEAGIKSSVKTIEEQINKSKKPASQQTQLTIQGTASISPENANTANVVAISPGNDKQLREEYIIVGAHHDHLGMGGIGSGSRAPDISAVHSGADDNASGVSVVIELAEKFASEKRNKRSIIWVTFAAEEKGLIGSKEFCKNPPVDFDKVSAMFNFDMVGRLDSTQNLLISGVGTSAEAKMLLDSTNHNFQLTLNDAGFGPSDHASFYAEDIPVFYLSTGPHSDYHTPADKADKINYEGLTSISKFSYDLILAAANYPTMLTYKESGPKTASGGRTDLKVTLGIMPDFAGIEKRGLRIDAVTPNKSAAMAGMIKGDIITAINGKKVGNIYDYMTRLKTLKKGEIITVDVLRNDRIEVLIVTL